jgi:hypothetical protein
MHTLVVFLIHISIILCILFFIKQICHLKIQPYSALFANLIISPGLIKFKANQIQNKIAQLFI